MLSTIDIAGTELKKQKEELDKQQDALQSLDRVIDSITVGMSRKAFNSRLKALAKISFQNTPIFCDHILAEQIEQNIKPSAAESKVKLLIWLSDYHSHKPFEQMTKQDILSYLNSIRKTCFYRSIPALDRGSYNGRLRYLLKFFRWLYRREEPDYRRRTMHPRAFKDLINISYFKSNLRNTLCRLNPLSRQRQR